MTEPLRLSFGCSNLGSDLGRKASRALVEAAYECGFRHFDVAPSYGNGLAEVLLGEALKPVRASVVITTKTGIGHPKAGSAFRAARKVFLPIKRAFPGLWKSASGQANRSVVARGKFGRDDIRTSISISLDRLGVERVDELLLHEVLPADMGEPLFSTLDELRASGQVGRIGIGTTVESSKEIVERFPDCFDIVQVNHHWGAFEPSLHSLRGRLRTHRWLKSGTHVVHSDPFRRLLDEKGCPREMRQALVESRRLPELLLSAALIQNPTGRLLVSSSKIDRLRAFADLARNGPYDPAAASLNEIFTGALAIPPE